MAKTLHVMLRYGWHFYCTATDQHVPCSMTEMGSTTMERKDMLCEAFVEGVVRAVQHQKYQVEAAEHGRAHLQVLRHLYRDSYLHALSITFRVASIRWYKKHRLCPRH